jgi:hypothetical protein
MFDGVLPRDDPKPEERMARRGWPWELWVLLLMLGALAVFAGVRFPEALSSSEAKYGDQPSDFGPINYYSTT